MTLKDGVFIHPEWRVVETWDIDTVQGHPFEREHTFLTAFDVQEHLDNNARYLAGRILKTTVQHRRVIYEAWVDGIELG